MNVIRACWWQVNVISGNGLVSSCIKPLYKSVMTYSYAAIWRCWGTLSSHYFGGLARKNTMTSWNGDIFRVTGLLCGEFTDPQRPETRSFDVFFDLWLNKPSSKQSGRWWFETPSSPLWRHCNEWDKSIWNSINLNQCSTNVPLSNTRVEIRTGITPIGNVVWVQSWHQFDCLFYFICFYLYPVCVPVTIHLLTSTVVDQWICTFNMYVD